MTLIRTDQFQLTVYVDNKPLGTWDKLTGGEADSEETKYRPGAMQSQQALGGPTMVSNITVSRAYDPKRDGDILPDLLAARGCKGAYCSLQPLDCDRKPFGKALVRGGILKQVSMPEHDSEATGAGMISLEISTDGDVAVQ